MSKRLIVLLAGVLAVVPVVAGCGGDDEATASSITRAEFVEQANEVCTEGRARARADFFAFAREHKEDGPQEADYTGLVEDVLAPNVEQEIEELRELGAPSGEEAEVEALWDAVEADLKTAEAAPERLATEGQVVFGNSAKVMEEYGLKVCGNR